MVCIYLSVALVLFLALSIGDRYSGDLLLFFPLRSGSLPLSGLLLPGFAIAISGKCVSIMTSRSHLEIRDFARVNELPTEFAFNGLDVFVSRAVRRVGELCYIVVLY